MDRKLLNVTKSIYDKTLAYYDIDGLNQTDYYEYYFMDNATLNSNNNSTVNVDYAEHLSENIICFLIILSIYMLLVLLLILVSIYAYRQRIGYNYDEFDSIPKQGKIKYSRKIYENYKKIFKAQKSKVKKESRIPAVLSQSDHEEEQSNELDYLLLEEHMSSGHNEILNIFSVHDMHTKTIDPIIKAYHLDKIEV
jgi:hypothetical protein